MSNCPKCRSNISLSSLGFLSEKRGLIKCPACHTKLTVETPNLDRIAAKSSSLIAAFIFVHELINDNPHAFLSGVAFGTIFMGVSHWAQYRFARLSVALNQSLTIGEEKEEEKFTLRLRPPLSNNPSRVEFLKNVYHDAPPERLENIAADEYMTDEARIAARDLLQQQ